jgi:hypothetical protein
MESLKPFANMPVQIGDSKRATEMAKGIEDEFVGRKPEENAKSALLAYERTEIGEK